MHLPQKAKQFWEALHYLLPITPWQHWTVGKLMTLGLPTHLRELARGDQNLLTLFANFHSPRSNDLSCVCTRSQVSNLQKFLGRFLLQMLVWKYEMVACNKPTLPMVPYTLRMAHHCLLPHMLSTPVSTVWHHQLRLGEWQQGLRSFWQRKSTLCFLATVRVGILLLNGLLWPLLLSYECCFQAWRCEKDHVESQVLVTSLSISLPPSTLAHNPTSLYTKLCRAP